MGKTVLTQFIEKIKLIEKTDNSGIYLNPFISNKVLNKYLELEKQQIHSIVFKSHCSQDRVKKANSNECAEFVNNLFK
jgi:hypothetical protein